jgi:hypothetical protein
MEGNSSPFVVLKRIFQKKKKSLLKLYLGVMRKDG